jgi:hypothetical protein
MSIRIEKNIPLPQRSRLPDLPFQEMQIGDSFLAPVSCGDKKSIGALRQRVSRFQRMNPKMRFSVVQDGEQMRVFRVA